MRTVLLTSLLLLSTVLMGEDHCPRLIQAVESALVDTPEVSVKAEFVTRDTISVRVENQRKAALRLQLQVGGITRSLLLSPLKTENLAIHLKDKDRERNVTAITAITSRNTYTYSCRKPKIIEIPRLTRKAVIDGILDEYATLPVVPMEILSPPDAKAWGAWQGDDDLSVQCRIAYDDQYIYLAIAVRDDIHVQELDPRQMWKQDNLEFTFVPHDNANKRTSFRFGIRNDGREQAYCWDSPVYPIGPKLDRVKYRVIRRNDRTTVYEIAVPLSDLGLSPKNNELLEIRLDVSDCDDPGGIALYHRLLDFWNTRFVFGK